MSLFKCDRTDCDICEVHHDTEPPGTTSEELYGEAAGERLVAPKLSPDQVVQLQQRFSTTPGPIDWEAICGGCKVCDEVANLPPSASTPDYFTKKNDQNKPRMSLLPFDALVWVAKVLTFGARKYSAHSWRTIPDALERYEDALLRHSVAIQLGEEIDPESGLPHQAHRACDALFCCALACAKYAKNSVELLAWGSTTAKL